MGNPPKGERKGAVAWFCSKQQISFKMVAILLMCLVDNEKKYTRFTGNFEDHEDAPVQFGAHCPIEHNQGFTWSH